MKKKIVSLFMVLVCLCSVSLGAQAAIPFTDVPSTAWYYDAVNYVYTMGLMDGTSPTQFSPKNPVTREMAVTLLGRLAEKTGKSINGSSNPFTDVKSGTYYYKYINWAYKNNIVDGVTPTRFGVGNPITRQDFCVLLTRFSNNYMHLTIPRRKSASPFADDSSIAGYAKTAVYTCARGDLIQGRENNLFVPAASLTRAEIAYAITYYIQYVVNG